MHLLSHVILDRYPSFKIDFVPILFIVEHQYRELEW